MKRPVLWFLMGIAAAAWGCGSDGDSNDDDTADTAAPGDTADTAAPGDTADTADTAAPGDTADTATSADTAQSAPQLDASHPGWQKPDCSTCHDATFPDHFNDHELWECAKCHGGNGAPTPPSAIHSSTCSDASCHGDTQHGVYTEPTQCNWCHFGAQ